MKRARDRWSGKPELGDCTETLHEKADQALCQAATNALLEIEGQFAAPPARTLPTLADGALALTRLSERVRYLSLAELSSKKLSGDAGTAPAASAARPSAMPSHGLAGMPHEGQHSLQLSDGPVSQMMGQTVHLERDVIRNLGAYLEYAELPVRRSALEAVKRLHGERIQW